MTLQEVRAYKGINNCNSCYTAYRSIPEMSSNPLNAVRMLLEAKRRL